MATELLLCQAFENLSYGVQVGNWTVVRHILRVSTRLFQERSYLANLEQVRKDPFIEGIVCEPGEGWSENVSAALQK